MALGDSSVAPISNQVQKPPAAAPVRVSAVERREIVAALKQSPPAALQVPNRGFSITIDNETKQTIVRIVDRGSGEVVQQFPGRDAVERARFYRELEK